MQRRPFALLLMLGLPGSIALAEPPEAATEPAPVFFRAPARTLCMADGLRVRTNSLRGAPLARMQVSVDIGADRDLARLATLLWLRSYVEPPPPPPPEEGEAVEDAEDEIGPPPPPPPSVRQQLSAMGARVELVEGPDLLTLVITALPEQLSELVAMQQRQLSDPLANVTDADLDAARDELVAGSVDPERNLWRAAAAAMFPDGHPYHPAPGDLSLHSLDDVRAFAAKAFTPERLMLTLDADFSQLDDPKKSIQRMMRGERIPLAPISVPAPPPPAEEGEGEAEADGEATGEAVLPGPVRVVIEDDSCVAPASADPKLAVDLPTLKSIRIPATVAGPEAMVVWPLPGGYTDKDQMWSMFPVIAEEFMYRTLSKKMMPGQLPGDAISCSYLPGLQASAVVCRLPVARDGDQAKMGRKVTSANDVLWYPDAPTKLTEIFDDLRQRQRGRILLRAADRTDGELPALVWESTYDRLSGDAFPHLSRMSALDDLDPKKVLEAYRKWMNPERFTVVSLVPDGDQPDLITEDPFGDDLTLTAPWAPVPPAWEPPPPPPPPEDGAEPEEEEEDSDEDAVEEEAPVLLTAEELAAMASNPLLEGATRTTLDSGLDVVIISRPGYPVARATLVHQGGVLREQTPGLDAAAWQTSSPFNSNKGVFAPTWPLKGQATWHRERLPGAWVQGLTGPAGSLDGMLYILREAVRDASVDEDYLKEHLHYEGRRYRPTAWRALRLATYDAFFGDDAAISDLYVDKKSRKLLTPEQIQAWTDTVISPKSTTLVVVTSMTAAEVQEEIEGAFGDWSGTGQAGDIQRPAVVPKQSVVLMNGPGPLAETQIRCPLGSPEADNPAARMLLTDMLQLRMWEATRDNPPVGISLQVEELGGGEAWLRASYETPIPDTGNAIVAYRVVLADMLAELEETIKLQELEEERLALLETLTAALEVKPRPNRAERKRLGALIEAAELLGELEEPSEVIEPELKELARIVEAGESLPEPEEVEEEEESEDAVVEITYEDPPRPTLEDARARRARLYATAYRSPSSLMADLIAEQAYGRPWLSAAELAEALVAVDEVALRDQLQACVGHDIASVYAPAEVTTPSLVRAGLDYEPLDMKAFKKR